MLETQIADVRSWWEKFRANLARVWAYATAWATTIWAGIWAWWGSMDRSEQAQLVGNYIAANKVPVILGFGMIASYVIAKGWPQPVLKVKVEAAHEASKLEALAEEKG